MKEIEIIKLLKSTIPAVKSSIPAVCGALFTAIFLRKNTSTQEFEKLKAGKLQEVANDLLNSGKMTYTEFYKASNFLSVAQKADEEYSRMPHNNSVNTYNFDWFIRFYEAVGNISDESMQQIWAKILAGEINKPLSYSLATIDTMKNLNQQDAILFTKVCRHCISSTNGLFLPNYENYYNSCQIKFSEILRLDELGLLNSSNFLSYTIPITISPKKAYINQDLIIFLSAADENRTECFIQIFPLTYIGNEIATLFRDTTSDKDFILFAKEIAKNKSVIVSVNKIVKICDNSCEYEINNLLNE